MIALKVLPFFLYQQKSCSENFASLQVNWLLEWYMKLIPISKTEYEKYSNNLYANRSQASWFI